MDAMPNITLVAETLEAIESPNTVLDRLAKALFTRCTTSGPAQAADQSWNATVLQEVIDATDTAGLYSDIADRLSKRTIRLGEEKGLTPDRLAKVQELVANTVSQLNGPFWAISWVRMSSEGATAFLAEATKEGATWGSAKRFARERAQVAAFHPDRGGVECSYTPTGTDQEIRFKVSKASKDRDRWTDTVETAAAIKADSSSQWSAVERQFRAQNPAGMQDARSVAEREKALNRAAAAAFAKLPKKERTALLIAHS
jgi:hypothetical protein